MLFLCIDNRVAKKFRYYAIPTAESAIAALATYLGVPSADTPEEFADRAAHVLNDGNSMIVWSDEYEPESSDPWDTAKELRYRHSQQRKPN
jgi:hypothetical protein